MGAVWSEISMLARSGDLETALIWSQRALAEAGERPEASLLAAAAIAAADAGAWRDASDLATRAIRIDPSYVPAYPVLGLAYDRLGGMSDRSILVWGELAELRPDLAVGHVLGGEALFAAGLAAEAREAWDSAASLEPGGRGPWNLALLDLLEEGLPAGLEALRTASFPDPTESDLFLSSMRARSDLRADVRHALDLVAADDPLVLLAAARSVLDSSPDDAGALSLAGFAMLGFASDSEALASSLRALTVSPGFPPALAVAGIGFARRPGLAAHAAAIFEGLLGAMPDAAHARTLHAESLLAAGRYAAAAPQAARAVGSDPGLVRARYVLAACLLIADRHAEAWWHVRRAGDHELAGEATLWEILSGHEEAVGS